MASVIPWMIFCRPDNSSQNSRQVCSGSIALAMDKVVWAKAHATVHGNELISLEVKPLALTRAGL